MESQTNKNHKPISQQPSPPSTPKKKPKYIEDSASSRRIKSISRLTQKNDQTPFYTLLVILWAIILIAVIFLTFQTKQIEGQKNATLQIQKCAQQYKTNRCQNPIKGLIQYCRQKKSCMEQQINTRNNRTISYSSIIGQIIHDFLSASGVIGIGISVLLFWLCLSKSKQHRQIVTLQFFDD